MPFVLPFKDKVSVTIIQRIYRAGGNTCRFQLGDPVIAKMTLAGNPFMKIKARNLERTCLITISAAYTFCFVYDHRSCYRIFVMAVTGHTPAHAGFWQC